MDPSKPLASNMDLDELRRALAVIGVVATIDGHDVVRRASMLEIVDLRISTAARADADKPSRLPLFYVRDADNDHDLMVRAPTTDETLDLWRKHYELEADALPTYIGPVPLDVPGAIDWDIVTTRAVHYKPFPG